MITNGFATRALLSLARFAAPTAGLMVALWFGQAQALHIVIQPIQVCNDAGGACAAFGTFEAATDKIWSQAGLGVDFLALSQLNETDFLITNADTVANGGHPANEHVSLFQAGNALVGDPFVTKIINMYFIDAFADGAYGLGCGAAVYAAFCGNEAGVIISDDIFTIDRLDTIAHEIGHVLGLTHDDFGAGGSAPNAATAKKNLMTSGTFPRTAPDDIDDITPDGLGLSVLTLQQINIARASEFIVPEPATLALFGLGLFGAGLIRRRRAA